jgi:plastocyanin
MNGVHIRTWPLVAALTMAGGFVALGVTTPAPAAESPQVLMVDNEPDLTRWHYEPADITVPAGTTVVWFNKGKEDHTVTADDKSYDSGLKKTGGTFSRAFAQPGKYSYHCAPHPWMKGTVQVVASRTAAASAPTPTTAATTTTTAPAAPPVSATAPGPAAGATAPPAGSESAPATPDEPEGESQNGQDESDENASPASDGDGSGGNLVGTLAVVLLPTLGALALGAKLRQSST